MATGDIQAKSTDIVEDITSHISYGTGYSSSDILFKVKRMGKLVIVSFTLQNVNILPSEAWGRAIVLTGLPIHANSSHSRISGMTLNNKIPFCVKVEGGVLSVDKLNNSTGTDSIIDYFGGIITYFAD